MTAPVASTTPRDKAQKPVTTFAEIRAVLKDIPIRPPEHSARAAARLAEIQQQRGGEHSALLFPLAEALAAISAHYPPRAQHPRIALFSAHGDGDSAQKSAVREQIQRLMNGGDPLNTLGSAVNADVRVYDLDAYATTPPHMHETLAASAIAYGMMAVEAGVDLLLLGQLFPTRVSVPAAQPHQDESDVLDQMCIHATPDLAAMIGALIAARFAGIAVVLCDRGAQAAAHWLYALAPQATDVCFLPTAGDRLLIPFSVTTPDAPTTSILSSGAVAIPLLQAAAALLA